MHHDNRLAVSPGRSRSVWQSPTTHYLPAAKPVVSGAVMVILCLPCRWWRNQLDKHRIGDLERVPITVEMMR